MNFDFSPDQKFLKDQARRYLTDRCPVSLVRGVLNDPAAHYSATLWQGVAEMGWLGVAIPEEHGGLGLGMLELCVLAEEMGRALAPVPFSSSVYFFTEALKLAASPAQQAAILPGLATGEIIGAWATSEGPGRTDPDALSARVSAGRLSGTKIPVTDAMVATHALVLARDEDGAALFLADLNGPGVTRTPVDTLDPTRGHGEIAFDATPVERVGGPGTGALLTRRVLERAAVLLAFEQIGGGDRALELATAYAKERQAFGRPIGGYQGIKHKLADAWIKGEVARSNAYFGAWALHADAPDLPAAAASARIAASEFYWFAAKEGIQTHGGMGFTWEVDAHLHYRRAQLLGVQAGSSRLWKSQLVAAIEASNAA
jgi:alkylation response protein AidB-like acyl-CoA dehydrogenase